MEIYLLKFSACLFVLWLVYVLFLERQNMHLFKRFYLLGALVLALAIPNLTITKYVEPVISNFTSTEFLEIVPLEESSFFTLENSLWLIYGLGVLLFVSRFVINLLKMQRRISINENITKRSFVYVLLQENLIPHSFFRYIFLNKTRYQSQAIPKEVLLHEETHAKQLHSLDIIIIELLQIVFWFHPLIYILKHHVKLNHEFLADQAVLNQGSDAKVYQNILLQFSSNTHHHQLSSAINYSSIKKRFTVMKTQTSKTRIWLSTFLVLPVITILFFNFAERVEVEKEIIKSSETLSTPTVQVQKNNSNFQEKPIMVILINRKGQLLVDDELGSMKSIEAKLKTLTKTFDNTNAVLVKYDTSDASEKTLKEVRVLIRTYDFKATHVDATLDIVPPPPPPKKQKKLKGKGGPNSEVYETAAIQEKVSAKQVAAYNAWAKKLNNQDTGNRVIRKKDHDKYKRIYGLMTAEQKKNAESFPQIPPPPPPPPAPKVKKGETSNIPIPPPPPPTNAPESTLDFVIRMAKANAKFNYDGKSISSDEAIELIKRNPKLNVGAQKTDTNQPIIYFFEKPIVVNEKAKN